MNKKWRDKTEDYYLENGYIVFTEKYHLNKGFCCGNGCRHCPYQYQNVPEPRRSELLKATNKPGNEM